MIAPLTTQIAARQAAHDRLAFGLAQFSRLREQWLRLNGEIFGHRLLMDVVIPGGVARQTFEGWLRENGFLRNTLTLEIERVDEPACVLRPEVGLPPGLDQGVQVVVVGPVVNDVGLPRGRAADGTARRRRSTRASLLSSASGGSRSASRPSCRLW